MAEREGEGRQCSCLVFQYAQVALEQEWPGFFFPFGRTKLKHAKCINIMYEFDSTGQKFDF